MEQKQHLPHDWTWPLAGTRLTQSQETSYSFFLVGQLEGTKMLHG